MNGKILTLILFIIQIFVYCNIGMTAVSDSESFSLLSARVVEKSEEQSSPDYNLIQTSGSEIFLGTASGSSSRVDVGFFYTLDTEVEELSFFDIEVFAKTSLLGPIIEQQIWQKDRDPYFYWDTSNITADVAGYSFAWDEEDVDNVVDTLDEFYQVEDGVLEDGQFTFKVRAVDENGGVGKASEFEVWVDGTAPLISSVEPAGGAMLSEGTPDIKIRISDELSGLDISTIELSINDKFVYIEFDETTGEVFYKPVISLLQGDNTIVFSVLDKAKNKTAELVSSFFVDTLKPTGSLVINAGDESTYTPFVSLKITGDGTGSDVAEMQISNDISFVGAQWQDYSFQKLQWQLMPASGMKTVYVKFKDICGNISDVIEDSIEVLAIGLDTLIKVYPEQLTSETEVEFEYVSSIMGARFSYKLDDSDWSEWSSFNSVKFENLFSGNHYFFVRSSFDSNGNGVLEEDEIDPTPATYTWTVAALADVLYEEEASEVRDWYAY